MRANNIADCLRLVDFRADEMTPIMRFYYRMIARDRVSERRQYGLIISFQEIALCHFDVNKERRALEDCPCRLG